MSNGIMKNVDGTFKGEVRTMRLCFSFILQPITNRQSDKAPHYNIIARAPAGHTCQVGAAWEATIKNGENTGQSMFTLQLDDPEFGEHPIYISAFPSRDGYSLQVDRKRGQSSPVGDAAEAAAA